MKTNVCKIALMFLIGTALSLLFNSCSKDPVIPENETDNKLHEDPSKNDYPSCGMSPACRLE